MKVDKNLRQKKRRPGFPLQESVQNSSLARQARILERKVKLYAKALEDASIKLPELSEEDVVG